MKYVVEGERDTSLSLALSSYHVSLYYGKFAEMISRRFKDKCIDIEHDRRHRRDIEGI